MTTKTYKCTGCKKRFSYEEYEPVQTPNGKFHTYDCAIEYAAAKIEKNRKDAIKKAYGKKWTKRSTKKTETRSELYQKLQVLVNQYVLHVRDEGKPCFTCGTTSQNIKYDAGHRHHAGAGGGDRRRFELKNIHKQCSMSCNHYGGGKPAEYDKRLDITYGKGFAEYLNCIDNFKELKEQFPAHDDIRNEIQRYRELLRESGIKPNR